jgi:Mg-chelatase subunit ChlD
MSLSFADPRALVLLLALPLAFLVYLLAARARRGAGNPLALGLRLAILAAVVLALAQPSLARSSRSLSVVFAVDASDSLGPQDRAQALTFVRRALDAMRSPDQAGVVAFGKEARVLLPVQAAGSAGLGQPLSLPDGLGQGTDVAAGLKLAASLLLPDGARRIVLVSDGQDNGGKALEEARQLEASGIQVVTVPVGKIPNP